MAASKTTESRDGGLVMHTKMVRYERVISVSRRHIANQAASADGVKELNHARLRKEPFELCQALARSVDGDSVSSIRCDKSLTDVTEIPTTPIHIHPPRAPHP